MNTKVSLQQVNELKAAMDADILKAIKKFQDATDLRVSGILLRTQSVISSENRQVYAVTSEVRL